jgi:hypothetical protein
VIEDREYGAAGIHRWPALRPGRSPYREIVEVRGGIRVLKETAEEQGCFRGCAVFMVGGGILGIIIGIFVFNKVLDAYNFVPIVSGSLGALLGLIIGSIIGAIVGFIWGKVATKKKITEEEF